MRVKSRYRNAETGGAVNEIADASPAISQRQSEQSGLLVDVTTPGSGAVADSDDASLAIQHQIAALNKSEESQRQRQALPPPQAAVPTTREEKLQLWESQGSTRRSGNSCWKIR